MQQKKEDTPIKRMADLLRQGATLTDLSCPVCASPLFRLKDGTLWCEQDQKKVIIVKEGEQPPTQVAPQANTAYDKLETTLLDQDSGNRRENRKNRRHRRNTETKHCPLRTTKQPRKN